MFTSEPAALLRSETISIEANAGYLTGQAKEYVYDTGAAGKPKLSQLTWNLGSALTVGGRVAARPLDWLTLRLRGWSTVTSDSSMHDYDWLYGYRGFNSFTHVSFSPDTIAVSAWQVDGSVAAAFYQQDDLALTLIGGHRHLTTKWNAKGGSYIYSEGGGFRNVSGTFPPGVLAGAYQQWWDAPYLGLGATYTAGDLTLSTEVIGSPYVMARSTDHHNLRDLVIKDEFQPSSMFGVSAGLEYRFMPGLSLAGRVEYQRYAVAKGDGTYLDGVTGTASVYKKGAGADAENLSMTLGVKARM